MKAIEQYFHGVLFIMLYKVVLTFKSVDETLVCDHSNKKLLRSSFTRYCLNLNILQHKFSSVYNFTPYSPSSKMDSCKNVIIVDVQLVASFLVGLSFFHDTRDLHISENKNSK